MLANLAPCTSRANQQGFTLIEVLITVSILAAFVLASMVMLVHRNGDTQSSRENVVALLSLAKAKAAANADVRISTGSTIGFLYESATNQTELKLYEGRPFRGFSGLARVENVPPLEIRGKVALTGVSDARNARETSDFALFIGASGRTSFAEGYHVDDGGTITEPGCDDTQNIRLRLSNGATDSKPIVISCATGEVMNANDPAN